MIVILLFTSPVFINWLDTHIQTSSTSAFNPYLVRVFKRESELTCRLAYSTRCWCYPSHDLRARCCT